MVNLPVTDLVASTQWYEQLFGRPADRSPMPGLVEWLSRATHGVTVKRVFGEPIERDGTLLVPVTRVRGAVGGGGDGDGDPDAEGSGGGLGFTARPVGTYSARTDVAR